MGLGKGWGGIAGEGRLGAVGSEEGWRLVPI